MVLKFFGGFQNFLDFCLVDAFDVTEVFFGGHDDAGYCAIAAGFEFGDISSVDAALLKFLNFEEGSWLDFFRDVLNLFLSNFFFFFRLFSLLHSKKSKIKN